VVGDAGDEDHASVCVGVRRVALLLLLGALVVVWRRRSARPRLSAAPGERVLVVGAVEDALALTGAVAPGGTVELVDARRERLDAVLTAAAAAGLDGIVATQCSPESLPFADGSIDAAWVGVRGEAAVAEARRVVRPGGRVVSRD
jgi:ubiquinone/menaquinone biosynthesis C-methylase UbiE